MRNPWILSCVVAAATLAADGAAQTGARKYVAPDGRVRRGAGQAAALAQRAVEGADDDGGGRDPGLLAGLGRRCGWTKHA